MFEMSGFPQVHSSSPPSGDRPGKQMPRTYKEYQESGSGSGSRWSGVAADLAAEAAAIRRNRRHLAKVVVLLLLVVDLVVVLQTAGVAAAALEQGTFAI